MRAAPPLLSVGIRIVARAPRSNRSVGRPAYDLPDLAEHLRASLQIGTYCAYRPDPLASVAWTTAATA